MDVYNHCKFARTELFKIKTESFIIINVIDFPRR